MLLNFGIAAKVFDRATSGSSDPFVLPAESHRYDGSINLQPVGVGGTITALVVDLEISLDAGTTWSKLVTGITLTGGAVKASVSGLGSGAQCRLTSTTFTLGTGSGAQILALCG